MAKKSGTAFIRLSIEWIFSDSGACCDVEDADAYHRRNSAGGDLFVSQCLYELSFAALGVFCFDGYDFYSGGVFGFCEGFLNGLDGKWFIVFDAESYL